MEKEKACHLLTILDLEFNIWSVLLQIYHFWYF